MKTYLRLAFTILCTVAAFIGPIIFLEDRPKPGYLLGGLAACLATWALLSATMSTEERVPVFLRGVLGACAGLLSWAPISLVAVFDVIPHMAENGFNRFDPVWIGGGVIGPLLIAAVAAARAVNANANVFDALMAANYRYSIPLVGVDLIARIPNFPKQYPWLFLFTGAAFLTMDAMFHRPAPASIAR
ncbi:MAG TPA: hypothetical protein VD969_11240 [Symbiobacteriaceae bacterium]|nr:hypothetical protein [Symbiobacteriaceae bacterium]